MLILTRRIGETLHIGDDVTVTVLGRNHDQIRLGINAPETTKIHREEIYEKIQDENVALRQWVKQCPTDFTLDDVLTVGLGLDLAQVGPGARRRIAEELCRLGCQKLEKSVGTHLEWHYRPPGASAAGAAPLPAAHDFAKVALDDLAFLRNQAD